MENSIIKVSQAEKEELLNVLKEKETFFENKLKEVRSLITRLQRKTTLVNSKKIKKEKQSEVSPCIKVGWANHIVQALSETEKCMPVREICRFLEKKGIQGVNMMSSVSATISALIARDTLIERYESEKRSEYLIGLKAWFEKGKVLPQYKR